MKEVLLDTETTGLSSVNDKIIEIACIEIEDHIPTGEKFHVFLNPEMEVSQGAYDTHGISKEFLKDKLKFKDVAKDFIKFIDGKKLVIHNAEFDLAFLNKELKEVGEKQISKDNIVDTLNVAREKFPGAQNSLDALCKRFKIDNSRRQKHSALLDCELLAKVYIELLEKKEPTFEFDLDAQDESIQNVKSIKDRKQIIVQITDDEKKLHKEFLQKELPKSSMLN
ncbi:MAG: DNA polymerase III subunit epsilon [Pelagibacteraceae bacterium]|nr:DNA polymerase III subunit epsilon [Pelagibacteraceae bacterium]OUV88360.1 MAG: DNA polymerase III subunit epsilon [Pelagibacteraceae bacterium TMED146]|tara:strand:+ start:93 stop:764 length:672 start_codon:yes stop_codon:yes gene_type:complete